MVKQKKLREVWKIVLVWNSDTTWKEASLRKTFLTACRVFLHKDKHREIFNKQHNLHSFVLIFSICFSFASPPAHSTIGTHSRNGRNDCRNSSRCFNRFGIERRPKAKPPADGTESKKIVFSFGCEKLLLSGGQCKMCSPHSSLLSVRLVRLVSTSSRVADIGWLGCCNFDCK